MKKLTLIQAISLIALKMGISADKITAIKPEDGSGYRFLYKVDHGVEGYADLIDHVRLASTHSSFDKL